MKREKLILTLSWIIVLVTLLSLIVTLNKFGVITGQATDTGEANLSITKFASIRFTDAICDFGSGNVDEDSTYGWMYTNNGSTQNLTGLSACDGLIYQNDGNSEITVNLSSDTAAAGLLPGGTSPAFEWMVDDTNCDGVAAANTYTTISAGADVTVCSNLSKTSTQDVDFYLKIPEDAYTNGESSAVITVTGSAI
ncbi:hypothetical protein GF378_02380 [Candidatus Pacearchaeota archaeon]|nr:hypothetical protein [Candidatus Pacearchaeota archaeon]